MSLLCFEKKSMVNPDTNLQTWGGIQLKVRRLTTSFTFLFHKIRFRSIHEQRFSIIRSKTDNLHKKIIKGFLLTKSRRRKSKIYEAIFFPLTPISFIFVVDPSSCNLSSRLFMFLEHFFLLLHCISSKAAKLVLLCRLISTHVQVGDMFESFLS